MSYDAKEFLAARWKIRLSPSTPLARILGDAPPPKPADVGVSSLDSGYRLASPLSTGDRT